MVEGVAVGVGGLDKLDGEDLVDDIDDADELLVDFCRAALKILVPLVFASAPF